MLGFFWQFNKNLVHLILNVWRFVNDTPKINHPKSIKDLSAHTVESDALSKDLKKRSMSFVGSKLFMLICYWLSK